MTMTMAFKAIETILIIFLIFCFCFGLFSILFDEFDFTCPPRKIKKINFQKWENNRKKENKKRKQKIIKNVNRTIREAQKTGRSNFTILMSCTSKEEKKEIIQCVTEYLQSLGFKVRIVSPESWSDFYFDISIADSDPKTP